MLIFEGPRVPKIRRAALAAEGVLDPISIYMVHYPAFNNLQGGSGSSKTEQMGFPWGSSQGGVFRKSLLKVSVLLESEHNWLLKTVVFTVYVFFDVAHSHAIRCCFLENSAHSRAMRSFQGKFTRIYASSFGPLSSASWVLLGASWACLGRFLDASCVSLGVSCSRFL